MSTVTQPRPRRNDIPLLSPPSWRDGDVPVVSVGTEHRDVGEPIPARPLAAAVLTPEELEELADQEEIAYAARTGRNDAPGYAIGLILSRYRSVHRLYLETLQRLEATRSEFWPDECPELAPAAWYDPADELERDLASTEA